MKGESTMAAEINNIPYKIYLSEDEMPKAWYNVRADMKVKPAPLLNPGTGKPMGFDDLRPVFCDELIRQELDNDDREIPIPQEILDFYKMYRPSPLVRAYSWKRPWAPPPRSTTSLRATTPPAPTSSTAPSPRPITPSSRASRALPPRPVPASGARPCPWPAPTWAWTARSTW